MTIVNLDQGSPKSIHALYPDVVLFAVTGRLNYSVAFNDISLILRSIAVLFRQEFKLIFINCVLHHYLIAVRA